MQNLQRVIKTLSLISGQAMTLNQSLNWSRGGVVMYAILIEAENAKSPVADQGTGGPWLLDELALVNNG